MNIKRNVIPDTFSFVLPALRVGAPKRKFFGMTFLILLLLTLATFSAHAEDETENGDTGKSAGSGLPIPRFASLRASDVNLRTGPGTRYPIEWVFTHRGMPVEITAEYETWRRVRDADGDEGWVHKNGLTGTRSAIVTGSPHELRQSMEEAGPVTAHLEAGAIGQIVSCSKDWCKLRFENVRGYLRKTDFWGAYPGEVFD
jgi:SH3-like domain-containing protein